MSNTAQPRYPLYPVVAARIGPAALGSDTDRRRPMGRIGGLLGRNNPAALGALSGALGPGAQILPAGCAAPHPTLSLKGRGETTVIADCDGCQLDGKALQSPEQWQAALVAGRLADVSGAFALAWLAPDGSLTLGRDAIGERTLYYSPLPDGIVFASTIRALLTTGLIERSILPRSVAAYLACAYLPGRETLVSGVYELLPGEALRLARGELTRSQFWSVPPEDESPPNQSEAELQRALRARLEDAVRRRLPAGETVGATLSGGLDSSLVVALAAKLQDAPVNTFSVSFGSGYANELPFSSLLAAHCGTRHRILEISPAAVLRYLDDSIGMLSDPIGDPLTVPNALLFREASAETGVVLNGEGGDPCFGGPKNLPMLLAELYDDGPLTLPSPRGGEGNRDDGRFARARSYLRAHLKCYDELNAMLTPPLRAALREAPLEESVAPFFEDPRWKTFVTKLQAMNVIFKGGHHILPKVDAVSAPFGVLARSPLFDRAVVELSFAIPPQLKLRGSVEKYLLKQAVRDLLPAAILERPKSGMLVPVEAWFQGPLLPEARARLLDGLSPYRLIEKSYLEQLLAGRLGGPRPRRGAKIWLLLTLEAWLRGQAIPV